MPPLTPSRPRNATTDRIYSRLTEIGSDQAKSQYGSLLNPATVTEKVSSLKASEAQMIARHKIYPNPLNLPYMEDITDEDIKALKASILDQGLLHNLVVLDDGNGRYRLISGEKRWTAISSMTDDEYFKEFPNGVLCKVLPHNPDMTEDEEKITLLTCNVLVFSNGSPDPKQLRDLVELYTKYGTSKKYLVDYLSKSLSLTERQLYNIINESNAVKELLELHEAENITLSALRILAVLKPEEQMKAVSIIRENYINQRVSEADAGDIKKSIKGKNKKEEQKADVSLEYTKLSKAIKSAKKDIDKLTEAKTGKMSALEKETLRANALAMSLSLEKFIKSIEE